MLGGALRVSIILSSSLFLVVLLIFIRNMKTLRPINIKQSKTTNPNNSFSQKRKKSCSGGIRTHDKLLARQML